jgi:hypothetical protein
MSDMAFQEGDSPASKLDLEGLGGEVRVKVDIPIKSAEYQDYLASVREMERQREESGGLTPEGIGGIRKAVAEVDQLAQKTLQRNKAN